MPRFIDLFVPRIQQNSSNIRNALLGYVTDSDAFDILKELLYSSDHWFDLPQPQPITQKIAGCDGSTAAFYLKQGARLGIVRALTKGNEQEFRTLDIGAIQGKDSTTLISHLMQLLELRCLCEYAEENNPEVLLMDGSPITYLSQNLIDFEVYLHKDLNPLSFSSFSILPPSAFTVLLVSQTLKLLRLIDKKKILFIGVSKDSAVSRLQQVILFNEIVQEIESLSIGEKAILIDLIGKDKINVSKTIEKYEATAKKYQQSSSIDWNRIMILLDLFLFPLTDPQALDICTPDSGYSCPIEIHADNRLKRLKKSLEADLDSFIEERYSFSLAVTDSSKTNFVRETRRKLMGIDDYPSIISSYVKVTPDSYPLRVDVLGERGAFWHGLRTFDLLDKTPDKLQKAINIVMNQYVDERIHNSILWDVDREVRLSRKKAASIYLSSLEHEIGLSRQEFLARREIRHF